MHMPRTLRRQEDTTTQTLANDSVTQDRPEARNRTLRILAVPILALLLIDSLVGDSLMYSPKGQPFPVGALALHVGVALLLVGVTGLALGLSLRLPGWRRRAAATFTHGSTVGATIAGIVFLVGGENPAALTLMEGLAVLTFLGAIALAVWGSVALPGSPRPPR